MINVSRIGHKRFQVVKPRSFQTMTAEVVMANRPENLSAKIAIIQHFLLNLQHKLREWVEEFDCNQYSHRLYVADCLHISESLRNFATKIMQSKTMTAFRLEIKKYHVLEKEISL
jgi:hypothetical protein